MKPFLFLSDDAEQDIDEAFLWYEFQSSGLGKDFIQSIDTGLKTIELHPYTFPIILRSVRKYIIKKFPFSIYYQVNNEKKIEVIRVLHHKRKQKLRKT